MKTYECSFIDDILSETDDIKRENIINQLKSHLVELENNNKFVDELSRKFSSLQEEFRTLSYSKKQIETELNSKITILQKENEKINNKYISAKEQIQSLMNTHSDEINHLQQMNEITMKDNDNLLKENQRLVKQLKSTRSLDENILFYQKKLDEANSSIMKLNNIIKNLEEKNDTIMQKFISKNDANSSKEVVIGLRRVIDEKEKMINNLYNSYDKLSIKYEEILKKNEMLRNEITVLKNHLNTFTSSTIPQDHNNINISNYNNTSSLLAGANRTSSTY